MTPASVPSGAEARHLLDRAAIHDVLTRYFLAIDRGDAQGVRSCFTEDAQAQYEGRPAVSGGDAVVASLSHHFGRLRSGELKTCSHFMGNLGYLHVAADEAETETYAIAFLVRPAAAGATGDRIAMRGLRYLDRLRRDGGNWLICRRVHTLDWACDEAASASRLFSERVMHLPAARIAP